MLPLLIASVGPVGLAATLGTNVVPIGAHFAFHFATSYPLEVGAVALAIGLASRVIQRFFPEAVPAQPARQGRSPVAPRTSGPTVDAQRSAVIAAAVHQHRQRHRNG